MQVLHLSCQFLPSVGGVELYLRDLCVGLRAGGIDARVLVLDRTFDDPATRLPRDERVEGVPVRRLPYLRFGTYYLAPGVLGALGRPDVLHVHNTEFFLDILPLLRRRLPGVPIVLTPHGGYFHTSALATLKALHARFVLPRRLADVDRLVAVGAHDVGQFGPHVAPGRLVEIPAIVRWQAFADVVPGGSGVLHLGRLSPNKRADRLADLVEDVPALGPLHVVGDARGADGDGLRGRPDVHVHGPLPTAALREVMTRCRYVASASTHEGFGIALVEGMAAGLLPLGNRALPSVRGIVTDGVNGALVPFGDRAAAARRVRALLALPEAERAGMAARARADARRYDVGDVVRQHQTLYAACARRPGGDPGASR